MRYFRLVSAAGWDAAGASRAGGETAGAGRGVPPEGPGGASGAVSGGGGGALSGSFAGWEDFNPFGKLDRGAMAWFQER